jgi:hypothetical protein
MQNEVARNRERWERSGRRIGLQTWLLVTGGNKSIPEKNGGKSSMMMNQAPGLNLCAAVVADILGFENDETLTVGEGGWIQSSR